MPTRVGITTDLERRKSEWEQEVTGFKNWKKIAEFATKDEAQTYETDYAKRNGYEAEPGGRDAPGPWYVYQFDYQS